MTGPATESRRPTFIDCDDEDQVAYWMQRLDATREELCRAVDKVGPHHTAVEIFMGAVQPEELRA
ncbi:MAG TPA: DUF3606 domain-containing protein [Phenylobacterium sp.]|nr:DUF3606 domain-containing protein [Phenylobacterium sp.]